MASPTTPTTPIYDPADKNKDGYISEAEFKAAHPEKVNAYDSIINMFQSIGITVKRNPDGSLDDKTIPGWIANAIQNDPTLLDNKGLFMSKLYESQPYKDRFSGLNSIRKFNADNPGNPMVVPSEAEYLQMETTYKQILSPVYKPTDPSLNGLIGTIIANNISPVELNDRVAVANAWVMNQDPTIKQALQTYYGIGDKELLGYALNPERGLIDIQKAAGAATLGAQALASSISLQKDQSEALVTSLTSKGLTKDAYQAGLEASKALQGLTTTGVLGGVQNLAQMEGTQLGTTAVLGAALGVDTGAATQIAGLKSRERARFEGSGAGTNVLAEQVSGTV